MLPIKNRWNHLPSPLLSGPSWKQFFGCQNQMGLLLHPFGFFNHFGKFLFFHGFFLDHFSAPGHEFARKHRGVQGFRFGKIPWGDRRKTAPLFLRHKNGRKWSSDQDGTYCRDPQTSESVNSLTCWTKYPSGVNQTQCSRACLLKPHCGVLHWNNRKQIPNMKTNHAFPIFETTQYVRSLKPNIGNPTSSKWSQKKRSKKKQMLCRVVHRSQGKMFEHPLGQSLDLQIFQIQ